MLVLRTGASPSVQHANRQTQYHSDSRIAKAMMLTVDSTVDVQLPMNVRTAMVWSFELVCLLLREYTPVRTGQLSCPLSDRARLTPQRLHK